MKEFSSFLKSFQNIEIYTPNAGSENFQGFYLNTLEKLQTKIIEKHASFIQKVDEFQAPSVKEIIDKIASLKSIQNLSIYYVPNIYFEIFQQPDLHELKQLKGIIDRSFRHRCFSEIQASLMTSSYINQAIQVDESNVYIKPWNKHCSAQNHLLIIEDDKGHREFILDGPVYSLGRDPKCDIQLISQFVSRRHATLVQLPNEDGTYYYRIVDGNLKGKTSANGLLINGRKLQSHDLKNEDEVVFGPNVRAIYYLLRRDALVTVPPDEFDITLIIPNMIGVPDDEEDLSEWLSWSYGNKEI